MMPKNMELERLRGFGIFAILLAHGANFFGTQYPHIFERAAVGIDLFFVISGFLVTRQFLRWIVRIQNSASPGSSFLDKYIPYIKMYFFRRVTRLFPLAIFWLIIYVTLLHFDDYWIENFDWQEIIAVAGLHMNFAVIQNPEYIFGYYWTLSIEEQFYIVMPIMIIALNNLNAIRRFFIAATICYFCVRLYLILTQMDYLTFFHTRYEGLAIGTTLAVLNESSQGFAKLNSLNQGRVKYVGYLLLFTPLILPNIVNASFGQMMRMELAAIFYGLLVVMAVQKKMLTPSLGILNPLFEKLGLRAYGYYLGHCPVLHFVIHTWDPPIGMLGQILLSIALGVIIFELVHRYLEKPIRQFGYELYPNK
jgi:peptidoglycan/LPS O-acetylase OafA/YrhL